MTYAKSMSRPIPLHEWAVRQQIDGIVGPVDQHVRLGDVAELSGSGLNRVDFAWATRAHIDLVVRDAADGTPLVAVEVDGPQHESDPEQARRDRLKDSLLQQSGVDVIRVRTALAQTRHGRDTLAAYLLDLWAASRAFYDAQEEGTVPLTEVFFHPFMFRYDPETRRSESLDPSMPFLARLAGEMREGGVLSAPATLSRYRDGVGRCDVRVFLPIAPSRFLYAETTVARFRIPGVAPSQVGEQIALLDIESQYDGWLEGTHGALGPDAAHDLWPRPVCGVRTSGDSWCMSGFSSGFLGWLRDVLGRDIWFGEHDGEPFYAETPRSRGLTSREQTLSASPPCSQEKPTQPSR